MYRAAGKLDLKEGLADGDSSFWFVYSFGWRDWPWSSEPEVAEKVICSAAWSLAVNATARKSEKKRLWRFSGEATILLGCCDHNFLLSPECQEYY
jgi:hypothetical protein